MQRLCLILFLATAGCVVHDAQLGLIQQSHKGVGLVRESVGQRSKIDLARNAAERRRLDEAFDDDLAARAEAPPVQWLIDARKAYAAAVDALHGRDEAQLAARDADLQNLNAVDAALDELARIVRSQRGFIPFADFFNDPRDSEDQ